jgi:hypothetical protein
MQPTDTTTPTHDVIIAEVARRMGVPEERLRGRDRTHQVAAARHAAFWALNQAGLHPGRIARLLGLNHSSVVHGLARAQQHPEWRALVAPAVALAGAGGQRPALRSWLARGLRDQPSAVRGAVHAYVTCSLLGWERHPGPRSAYGLWLVANRPRVRAAVAEALERCELSAFLGLIPIQAKSAGYTIVDSCTGARSMGLP